MSVTEEDQFYLVSAIDLPSTTSDNDSDNEDWIIVTPTSTSSPLPDIPIIQSSFPPAVELNPPSGSSRRPKVSVQQLCQTLPSPPGNRKRLPADHIEHERTFNEMGFGLLKYDLARQKADEERARKWAECPPIQFKTLTMGDIPAGAMAGFFRRQRGERELYVQSVRDGRRRRQEPEGGLAVGAERLLDSQGAPSEPETIVRQNCVTSEDVARDWELGLRRQHQDIDRALEQLRNELDELEAEQIIHQRRRPLNPLAPSFHFGYSLDPEPYRERA